MDATFQNAEPDNSTNKQMVRSLRDILFGGVNSCVSKIHSIYFMSVS